MRRRWTLQVIGTDGVRRVVDEPMPLFWTMNGAYRKAYILNSMYPPVTVTFVPVRRRP